MVLVEYFKKLLCVLGRGERYRIFWFILPRVQSFCLVRIEQIPVDPIPEHVVLLFNLITVIFLVKMLHIVKNFETGIHI